MAPTDADLVAAARAGDRAAFGALVERHLALLRRTCERAAGDRELAADAAQEAVLHALLGLDGLREPARFGSWLVGIGLNLCRRRLRERGRAAWELSDLVPDRAPGPAERAESGEAVRRVRQAIAALPRGQRDAVVLFHLAGLGHAEAAARLGTRAGAVKTRLHKARAALRPRLVDLREENPMPDHVEMRVADVRRAASGRHIVLLEEPGGGLRLPIWVGEPEGTWLALLLEDVALPRPGPYQLAAALLGATGAELREVRVARLVEHVFYAQAVLAGGEAVDARPSDALSLALVTGVPVRVAPAVLATAADGLEPPFAEELAAAPDGSGAIARDAQARLAEQRAELERLTGRGPL
jgi:RNA polymerase sigma-70 factor (ECF subfamily)